MSLLTLPNAGHPLNGEDLDADVVRAQIAQLLAYLQSLDLSNAIAGSLSSAAFDNNTSMVQFRKDLIASFISSGGLPGGFTLLQVTVPSIAGAYFASNGLAVFSIGGGTFTVAINQDTYFSVNSTGALNTPQGVANGAAAPTLAANSQWLFRTISNGTTITSIIDMRNLHGITPAVISNPYKFRVNRQAAANTSAGSFIRINFDNEQYDTSNNFDNVTNFRFTAPVAGFYQFNAAIQLVSSSSQGVISLFKNTSTEISRGSRGKANADLLGLTISDCLQLAINDTIEVQVYSNSTLALDVTASASQNYFSGFLVSAT